jgi:hypothetical protein
LTARCCKLLSLLVFSFSVFFVGVWIGLPQSVAGPNQGGFVYQNFESNSGIISVWSGSANTTIITCHSGVYGLYLHGDTQWNGVGLRAQSGSTDIDFARQDNDRLTFWIYAAPDPTGVNPVFVRFFDNSHYTYPNGAQVKTTQKAVAGAWTKLQVLFDQLPPDFDLYHVERVEFMNEWPGTYYLDDIQVVRENRIYQSFEPSKRGLLPTDSQEFCWVWGPITNTCVLTEVPRYEGDYSLQITLGSYWDGVGLKSEQEYLWPRVQPGTQTFWHVDLDPESNDRLNFWLYALPQNGLDNNVNVQFFDHGDYYTKPVNYWTNRTAVPGQWTQFTIPFSDILKLAPSFHLTDVDKLQFQMFWPGTYYLDEIKATSSVPEWDKSSLKDGVLKWKSSYPLNRYVLQENMNTGILSDTHWVTIAIGVDTSYTIPHISQVWYRGRAEEVQDTNHEIPFVSDWSEVLEYNAPTVVINRSTLDQEMRLVWTRPSPVVSYEVQSAVGPTWTWSAYYAGPYPTIPLTAAINTRYQVRAISGTEMSDWSPPQWKPDPPGQDMLRTLGTTIRNGNGEIVTLRGVNLGSYLLVEPWMNDWTRTVSGTEIYTDDFTIRQILSDNVGATATYTLFETYRDAFLTEADFDILKRMGLNLVRLPIYYIDLQDENGNSIPSGFDRIDWVVNACADRGMYVLLDLHGAPGSQSIEAHTGRQGYNRLFSDLDYQTRTVELWQDIAAHYKNNPTVMGYDLLNEPTGVGADTQKLWDFYDRLYKAVREIDPDHIIMVEGIWDWDTLPNPVEMGWRNVVYQFHYYYFCETDKGGQGCPPDRAYDDYVQDRRDFVNSKITMTHDYRYFSCQVPAMVGEFNAFESRRTWDYYLSRFNEQGWSWALWSYKVSWSPSRWGLMIDQSHSPDDKPDFRTDLFETLVSKMSTPFDTLSRYGPSYSLDELVKQHAIEPYAPPTIVSISQTVTPLGQVQLGDKLTYTLFISAVPGTRVAFYDLLEHTTFSRFIVQPPDITHDHGMISGTLTVTPADRITVSFVVQVNASGMGGQRADFANHACLYLLNDMVGCICSNEVKNFLAHKVYLPVVLR